MRLEVLGDVDVTAGFFTVQVGAFRKHANAERLRERLSASSSPIFIQQYDAGDSSFYRVRVGKISGEEAAQQYAKPTTPARKLAAPFVVQFDEAAPLRSKVMRPQLFVFQNRSEEEFPANLVYEDNEVFSFENVNPQSPTHI